MSYFLFQIEWVFWVYLLCAGAVKLHHYLGLGAVTISTGGNSHLSTVIVPARGGIGVPTHFSEPWTVIGITELLLGAIICPVSYTHLTLPTTIGWCRSRWSPYH